MEMNNGMATTGGRPDVEARGGQVFIGLALMLLGLAVLFERMDLWHLNVSARLWPFFLLLLGLVKFVSGPYRTRRGRKVRGGAWLIYIGLWGLINEYHLLGLDYDTSWPLLIVAAGLNMVWRSLASTRDRTQEI
jgi:hypothetical protein